MKKFFSHGLTFQIASAISAPTSNFQLVINHILCLLLTTESPVTPQVLHKYLATELQDYKQHYRAIKSVTTAYCECNKPLLQRHLNSDYCKQTINQMNFLQAGFEIIYHKTNRWIVYVHVSSIIPIPKGQNTDLIDSNNYGGISLSSLIWKTIDLIILSRYSDLLCTSELRFGFKLKVSTGMCTSLIK